MPNMFEDTTTVDGKRAALLHSAVVIAIDATKAQLKIKLNDTFRATALRTYIVALEGERQALESQFPVLKP